MKQSVRDSLNMSGHPLIQLELMGNTYWFVVDTGSNVNLISSDLEKELSKGIESIGYISTSGVGGQTEEGAVFLLSYSIDGNQFTDQFSVVDTSTFMVFDEYGVKVSGLLGTSFLLFHRCILDFSDGMVYLNGNNDEVRSEMRNNL